jgi:hypothetical protein
MRGDAVGVSAGVAKPIDGPLDNLGLLPLRSQDGFPGVIKNEGTRSWCSSRDREREVPRDVLRELVRTENVLPLW